jgi:hypothetical protein
VLVEDFGLENELEGWTLLRGNGISADGRSIVGFATNPEGNQEGFLVRLDEMPPPSLTGDYNDNGTVEQGDLDLVLLNWGQPGTPGGWVNDLPQGNIDQAELDGVLLNWGDTAAALGSAGAVPEPATLLMATLAIVVICLGKLASSGAPRGTQTA